jgi:TonB-dependent starch-binding outer membrane protein SusC
MRRRDVEPRAGLAAPAALRRVEPYVSGRMHTLCRAGGALLLLCASLVTSADLVAQQGGTLTGRVTDARSGAPLAAVQIFIENTDLGTLSRADGRFLIPNVPAGTHTVTAERIGYGVGTQAVTLAAGASANVEFAIQEEALALDQIIVTGTAGSVRARELGSTINQIDPDQMIRQPSLASDMLKSAAPGVDVTRGGAGVGSGSRIVLRGVNSVSMDNQPLIYIDGVRMMSEGFPVTADPYFGGLGEAGRSANVTISPLDNLNPEDIERIEIIKGPAATTLYGTEASAGVIQVFTKRGVRGAPVWSVENEWGPSWSVKFGTDEVPYLWLDASPDWLRTGYSRDHSLSVRGGGQELQYFVSGQYLHETGILPNDEQDKAVARGNFSFTPAANLRFDTNVLYSTQDMSHTGTGRNTNALTLNVYRQEANYFASRDPAVISQLLDQELLSTIERLTLGGTVTHTTTPNLTNRFTVGLDSNLQESRNIRPYGFVLWPIGGVYNSNWTKRLTTFEYVGTYGFDVSDALRADISWGGQAAGDDTRHLYGWGEDIPGVGEPTVSSAAYTIAEESREKIWNAGFFGQTVLGARDRYFLTLGARADGNSAFGSDFGLQVYPKASLSWIASDEPFWNPGWGELKVRAAYGHAGRAPGAFDATRTWTNLGWIGAPALSPLNRGNPELGPEVSKEFEAGFDAAILDNRISGSFTYYHQTTEDALMPVGQLASTGFSSSQLQNVGTLANWGTEATLDFAIVQRPNWGVDLGLNLSTNDSEVVSLGGLDPFGALYGSAIIEGYPVGVLQGERVVNPDEIADPIYEDDYIFGRTSPTQMHGVDVTLRLPYGVSLSARGEYQAGHVMSANPGVSIRQGARVPLCFPYYADPQNSIELRTDIDIPAIWRVRCTPELSIAGYTDYIWDADFFRARDLTMSVPVGFAFPDRVTGATLTLSLANFYLWTKDLPWWDPEVLGVMGVNSAGRGGNNDPMVPAPKTFRARLRVSF